MAYRNFYLPMQMRPRPQVSPRRPAYAGNDRMGYGRQAPVGAVPPQMDSQRGIASLPQEQLTQSQFGMNEAAMQMQQQPNPSVNADAAWAQPMKVDNAIQGGMQQPMKIDDGIQGGMQQPMQGQPSAPALSPMQANGALSPMHMNRSSAPMQHAAARPSGRSTPFNMTPQRQAQMRPPTGDYMSPNNMPSRPQAPDPQQRMGGRQPFQSQQGGGKGGMPQAQAMGGKGGQRPQAMGGKGGQRPQAMASKGWAQQRSPMGGKGG